MATYSSNFSAILALAGGGGTQNLSSVLSFGNTTGGSDIVFSASTGDGIATEDNAGGPGYTLDIDGSDAGGGNFNGGDINLNPGLASGTGTNGVVNINGDLNITGSVSFTNLVQGSGSPEGVQAAGISTVYQRTDGSGGNSLYVKMAGVGVTGWCPMGPRIVENFTSVGAAVFTTSRNGFSDPVVLGVNRLSVYWNGVLQREGGADDYTVVYTSAPPPGFITVTFNSTPPAGDLVTIEYLPE